MKRLHAKQVKKQDGYGRLNADIAVYVVASAIFCAIPVGMNRPISWLIWSMITAAAVVLYVVLGHKADGSRRLISWRFWPLFAGALVVPLWALGQSILPVSLAFPAAPEVSALVQHQISALPSASILAAVRFTTYILFLFLAVEVSGRRSRAEKMALWIFWGIVAHAVWALVALNLLGDIHIWGEDKSIYQGFATGTFVNRNSFASFLAMGAILGFTLVQDNVDNPARRRARTQGLVSAEIMDAAIMALGIAVIWVALLATGSRMGVFSAVVGMFVSFFAMRVKKQSSVLRSVFLFFSAAALLGVVGIFSFGQDLAWRSFFLDRDSVGRLEVYHAILGQISERPLIGYGFDTFRVTFEWSSRTSTGSEQIWDRAHSTYLSHWIELGVIVGSIPMILVGLCFARAISLWKRRSHDYGLPAAAAAVIVTQALHSTVDFSLEMPANVVLFLAIVAIGITPRQRTNHEKTEESQVS